MNQPHTIVATTDLPGLRNRGKVRDIYDLGDALMIVATDRISAFDVVMAEPVPDKGFARLTAELFGRPSVTAAAVTPHAVGTPR